MLSCLCNTGCGRSLAVNEIKPVNQSDDVLVTENRKMLRKNPALIALISKEIETLASQSLQNTPAVIV